MLPYLEKEEGMCGREALLNDFFIIFTSRKVNSKKVPSHHTPLDLGCKLNIHKTFRRCARRCQRLVYFQFSFCVQVEHMFINT